MGSRQAFDASFDRFWDDLRARVDAQAKRRAATDDPAKASEMYVFYGPELIAGVSSPRRVEKIDGESITLKEIGPRESVRNKKKGETKKEFRKLRDAGIAPGTFREVGEVRHHFIEVIKDKDVSKTWFKHWKEFKREMYEDFCENFAAES